MLCSVSENDSFIDSDIEEDKDEGDCNICDEQDSNLDMKNFKANSFAASADALELELLPDSNDYTTEGMDVDVVKLMAQEDEDKQKGQFYKDGVGGADIIDLAEQEDNLYTEQTD